MVGTNLKAETMSLMDKRSALEAEMKAIIDSLCQPGGPGLSGNLVDSEGFPRSDIDIPVVRAERRRLSELRNDHKEITDKLDKNIQILHSARLAAKGNDGESTKHSTSVLTAVASPSSDNVAQGTSSSTMDVDMFFPSLPFAIIDEITDASPAAEDGLQLGDRIVKFGNVEAGNNLIQSLASETRDNQGRAILVTVLRQTSLINITVTPRTWQGRGLLGCHFQIL
ncbi:PDZ_2 domain-containing protein [Cephalotus follicularis]|uniref:PDZ_2 domain-containing protein n=1 Tax=Cephalotus follicularis TaxID=3775 RepID=A0A1Q3CSI9_CEPFO|nr:PDZ_2 domain-containing protein [Cephalotus follicularis]